MFHRPPPLPQPLQISRCHFYFTNCDVIRDKQQPVGALMNMSHAGPDESLTELPHYCMWMFEALDPVNAGILRCAVMTAERSFVCFEMVLRNVHHALQLVLNPTMRRKREGGGE